MTKRDEIRAYLRSQWDGVTVTRIAEHIGETYDKTYDHLKNLKRRGEVEQDDLRRWYLKTNNVVPDAVRVYRTPEKVVDLVSAPNPPWHGVQELPPAPPTVDEPQEIVELAEHLDRVSVVPAAELEMPPAVEHMVTLKLRVTASVARQVLALLP